MNKEIKVLFIGNSYTFFNEMNKIFENICASSDKFVITTLITRGGARLDGYSNHNTQSGMKVQEELKNGYDYVFLQEQSNLPVVLKDKFFNSHNTVSFLSFFKGLYQLKVYYRIKQYNSPRANIHLW